MTFIENHHNLLVFYLLQMLVVVVSGDGTIQLLYGGDDDFGIAAESFYQLVGVVRTIYCAWFKGLVFRLRLRVEVVTVNHKHHLVYTINLTHQLCSLERGEGLACTCSMPNIPVLVGVLYLVEYALHGIILVRAQHHQAFVTLMQHDIFAEHLA